jgi:hypothetical protein
VLAHARRHVGIYHSSVGSLPYTAAPARDLRWHVVGRRDQSAIDGRAFGRTWQLIDADHGSSMIHPCGAAATCRSQPAAGRRRTGGRRRESRANDGTNREMTSATGSPGLGLFLVAASPWSPRCCGEGERTHGGAYDRRGAVDGPGRLVRTGPTASANDDAAACLLPFRSIARVQRTTIWFVPI